MKTVTMIHNFILNPEADALWPAGHLQITAIAADATDIKTISLPLNANAAALSIDCQ
jgi:hypothetical protein